MTRPRHTYRCPKCGNTLEVRARHAVLTCEASTYCASRGVLMVRDDEVEAGELQTCDSCGTLGSHNESDPRTACDGRGSGQHLRRRS